MRKNKCILFVLLFFMNIPAGFSQSTNKIISRIFVIMLENEDLSLVIQDSNFNNIADSGLLLTNYYGVTHPSQPNYIASIAGGLCDITVDDCITISADSLNLVDLLESSNTSWKAYMEDLPATKTDCYGNNYFRRHNPFVLFANNLVASRLSKVVNATQLNSDLANNAVPSFCWFTPNTQNDGHSPDPCNSNSGGDTCHVGFAGRWLAGFINNLQTYPQFMDSTLIVITFDECYPANGNDSLEVPIYTVLLAPDFLITKGSQYNGCYGTSNTQSCNYNHYNLLATIEKNFSLGNLGRNDSTSQPFNFLWTNSTLLNKKRKK